MAVTDLDRGISIFTQRSHGFMCRWSDRTRWPCSTRTPAAWQRRRRFRRTHCRSQTIAADINSSAPSTCTRTASFVYVANRASSTVDQDGRKVFAGGENSIAVFAIDPSNGKPVPIQHVDTHGIHCRTFHIDPTGRLMVCAHIMGLPLADGTEIPTRLTLFRIGGDGKLTLCLGLMISQRTAGSMWWMGMVTL